MKFFHRTSLAISLTVVAGIAWAQAPGTRFSGTGNRPLVAAKTTNDPLPSGNFARIPLCQTSLIFDIDVPAPESGPLVALDVEEGAAIAKDAVLAKIDDRQPTIQKTAAELERDAAVARAEDDIEVRFAEASHLKAQAEFDDVRAIEKKSPGSIPLTKIRELQLEVQRSKLQIDRSKLDLKVAKMSADVHRAKVQMTDDAIRRRQIVSPIDGEVLTIHRQRGEWVNAGDAVFRVAQLERLRVEGFLNAAEHTPGEITHRPVIVEVTVAQGRPLQFSGEVTFVSPLIQAGNKFRVRAEVQNRKENGHWLLQPGKEAVMTIQLK